MHASKVILAMALAGTGVWSVHSQPASPELQAKALELLRQTLSQERQAGAQTANSAAPVSSDQQQRAIELLRQKLTEERGGAAPFSAPSGGKPGPASQSSVPAGPGVGTVAPAANVGATNTPAVSTSPTGARTKQQRLSDLLEQYRADKLTPEQYHAERAKILAEP